MEPQCQRGGGNPAGPSTCFLPHHATAGSSARSGSRADTTTQSPVDIRIQFGCSGLKSFQIPDQFNTEVVYPIATTKGDNPAGGQAFVNFVLSPAGQHVLKIWNFLPRNAAPAAQPSPAA